MGGGADCESCETWRDNYHRDHMSDDNKQFLVVASGDFRHSIHIQQEVGSYVKQMIPESGHIGLEAPNGHLYPVEVEGELGDIVLRSGWKEFVNANHIEEDHSILFVSQGNSIFKVHIFNSSGHEKSSCSQRPCGVFGGVPPCGHHVLNEQVVPDPGHVQTSSDIVYTTLPGCLLTIAQDEKVLEIADTMKSELPLHVIVMNKRNINLKDSCVYIPLQLVLDHFKDGITKDTIQLETPDNYIYSIGASKHSDDLVVLDSAWDTFVASQCIQKKYVLIFSSTQKSRLKIFILDPSGREKTPSSFVMGNSSSTQESSGDSIQIVNPPPRAINLSSSDDDDIMREGTRECRVQKQMTQSSAKARKMASTSSPCTKSGYEARKMHDPLGVGLEPLSNNLFKGQYFLSRGVTLSVQAEKIVEEKVQAIGSEHPIFVKVISSNNVDANGRGTCEMVFCMEFSSTCLPDNRQTLFLQLDGKTTVWETTYDVRRNKLRRIYKGWREFSRQNAREVGDICLFKLEDTNTSILKMTVYLLRKSQIEQQLWST